MILARVHDVSHQRRAQERKAMTPSELVGSLLILVMLWRVTKAFLGR